MAPDALYNDSFARMEGAVHLLASRVTEPREVPFKDGFVYRHVKKTIPQAIVQKLARMVSTLRAARLLMEQGFMQELATLQRVLDELQEDVTFLSYAIIFDQRTSLHDQYLDAFFEEEFDSEDAVEATQKWPMIPRKRIRAWISNTEGAELDPSRGIELSRTISKTYSGYVHAASSHIMDLYVGDPPTFHMSGLVGKHRDAEHRSDFWNVVYRGLLACCTSAAAFRDRTMFDDTLAYSVEFARANGKDYQRA